MWGNSFKVCCGISDRPTLKGISTELITLSLFSRDERRWIEKQNRAARALRKKEEMNRIRTLVGEHTNCWFSKERFVN